MSVHNWFVHPSQLDGDDIGKSRFLMPCSQNRDVSATRPMSSVGIVIEINGSELLVTKEPVRFVLQNIERVSDQRKILAMMLTCPVYGLYEGVNLIIMLTVRIPTIATTHSGRSRPLIPVDRDQCGAGARSAAGCSR